MRNNIKSNIDNTTNCIDTGRRDAVDALADQRKIENIDSIKQIAENNKHLEAVKEACAKLRGM